MNIREILNRLDRVSENQDDRASYEDELKKSGSELPDEEPTGMDDEEPDTGHDDSGENLGDEEDSETENRFKQYAKDIGGDMFSLSPWNYDETWSDASFGPNEKIKTIIENLSNETIDSKDDFVVKKYLRQGSRTLNTDRILTQMIYDARHKRLFNLKAGLEDGVETSNHDFLEQDQLDIINNLKDLLNNWVSIVGDTDPNSNKDDSEEWTAIEDKVLSTLTRSLPSEREIRGGAITQKQKDNIDVDWVIQKLLDRGNIDAARRAYEKMKDYKQAKKDWSKELAPREKRK